MNSRHWKVLCANLVVTSMLFLAASCGLIKSSNESESTPPNVEEPKPQPPNADKVVQTGIAQLGNGQINEAIASFEKALKIDPNNSQASQYLNDAKEQKKQLITGHLHKGIEYFTEEQLEQAMAEWDAVLALDPNNEDALKYKKRTQAMLDALGK